MFEDAIRHPFFTLVAIFGCTLLFIIVLKLEQIRCRIDMDTECEIG